MVRTVFELASIVPLIRGVLSFCHSQLINSCLSIVLSSLDWDRICIVVWWGRHPLSWSWLLTTIGTQKGKVVFPSTVEASLACFHRCCILNNWGPLHPMIPSVWSLIAVRVRNHLALRGDKSLSSWLWHRLDILLHGTENRPSRWRINTRPGVGVVLTLMLLLALAF
jgi:hypothetical protein